MKEEEKGMNRRGFMKASAAVAGSVVLGGVRAGAEGSAAGDGLDHRNERPEVMAYRKLGRTNFMCSHLVFGCGSALSGGRGLRLLERAFSQGINFFDSGTDQYYKGSEKHLGPFVKRNRDNIWLTSKAMVREGLKFRAGEEAVKVANVKSHAKYWLKLLDASLTDLQTDYIDAYYLMGVENPDIVRSEEIGNAFLKAKEAGKVGHFGISTHTRAQECLEAAIETGWYSLAMIAITPAGWYDWKAFDLQKDSPSLTELQPLLTRAREAGIGLVGMKAARHLSMRKDQQGAYDKYYGEKLLASDLNLYQRSYAYVLENGLDVVNADMQSLMVLEQDIVAARDSGLYVS